MNPPSTTVKKQLRPRGTTRSRSRLAGPVKINTDAAAAILAPIYAALPNTQATGDHNLAYGEVEWSTLKLMVDYANKQEWVTKGSGTATATATATAAGTGTGTGTGTGKFYDLGSGRGRAVLYMDLAGPFENSVGIEVLPERIKLTMQALVKLRESIPTAGLKLKIYEASFLDKRFNYKDARVIYLSNLNLDAETQALLFAKLNLEMPKGSLLFCSSEPSKIPDAFEKVATMPEFKIHIIRHL